MPSRANLTAPDSLLFLHFNASNEFMFPLPSGCGLDWSIPRSPRIILELRMEVVSWERLQVGKQHTCLRGAANWCVSCYDLFTRQNPDEKSCPVRPAWEEPADWSAVALFIAEGWDYRLFLEAQNRPGSLAWALFWTGDSKEPPVGSAWPTGMWSSKSQGRYLRGMRSTCCIAPLTSYIYVQIPWILSVSKAGTASLSWYPLCPIVAPGHKCCFAKAANAWMALRSTWTWSLVPLLNVSLEWLLPSF